MSQAYDVILILGPIYITVKTSTGPFSGFSLVVGDFTILLLGEYLHLNFC